MRLVAMVIALVVIAPVAFAKSSSVTPTRGFGALVAKLVVATNARSTPGGGTIVWRASPTTDWGVGPQQLLVLDRRNDIQGRSWLKVRLPIRPNGSAGWIRLDHVLVDRTPYWVSVRLGARLVSVYRSGRLVRRFRAVIGAATTPTPIGLHAVYDPIPQPNGGGFIGPWALHLTAFSEVLDNYGGGPGRVAIHGRGAASLYDPLGTARSHGCVRVDNAEVSWLARTVPRGTPVDVRQ